MKSLSTARYAITALCLVAVIQAQTPRSRLAERTEPGAIYVEDILPKPVRLTARSEAPIYYQTDMQRVLGSVAPGTTLQLVAMNDTAYKVRGRARHGDVSGWMRMQDLHSPDPQLAEKLAAFYARQKKVEQLIADKQVALGMTSAEVQQSLGKPTRKSARVSASGREETLEYSIFDRVPQITTGRDASGNLVQTTIYVKVEVGRLTLNLQGGTVTAIEESMGNPLSNQGIQTVPVPITVW
ncbi:MAG: hypothetical protein ACOYMN_20130 [Roseimicrobium sp.]